MINLTVIKTIIFDLGQVIIDLDPDAVISRLKGYSDKQADEIVRLITESQVLIEYEVGNMTDDYFCDEVNKLLGTNIPLVIFEQIWNSFLGVIKPEKLQLMEDLKNQFEVLILSNTNAIHQREFDLRVSSIRPGNIMSDMVHTAHYSHCMGFRKPDLRIYERVLDLHRLNPAEVLFFDDRIENIVAAQILGIKGIQVTYSDQILDQLR
ncbi:MAG: HAD family phosphatase [Flammeovirgaceae bacterium]|jgi:glucose-1-phosphatase|nr:HAD family phosphatase [Flammeovirgaceae bacterium]|tara:strand:+ start:4720 stop:5343 length:624 start_codon:yes stop_codon:yes gene_type:complete